MGGIELLVASAHLRLPCLDRKAHAPPGQSVKAVWCSLGRSLRRDGEAT